MACRAVQAGYEIRICPTALNWHDLSPDERGSYDLHADASRLYVTFKRYVFVEPHPLRACAFAAVAPVHTLLAWLKRDGLKGGRVGVCAVCRAAWYTLTYVASRMKGRREALEPTSP